MKKLIFSFALCMGLALSFSANAQNDTSMSSTRMKFYYYPSSNVYYDVAGNQYWYWDEASSNWMEAATLPTTITLVKTPRYLVYHNDANVWQDNAMHQKKYKVAKNGSSKSKGDDGTKTKDHANGKTKTKGQG